MFNRSDYYTAAELARLMGVSRQAVCDWIKAGKLRALRVGHRLFVSKTDAEKIADK